MTSPFLHLLTFVPKPYAFRILLLWFTGEREKLFSYQ